MEFPESSTRAVSFCFRDFLVPRFKYSTDNIVRNYFDSVVCLGVFWFLQNWQEFDWEVMATSEHQEIMKMPTFLFSQSELEKFRFEIRAE